MIQLYNKVSHMKKLLRKTEKLLTTHDLRQKLLLHFEMPGDDLEAYVPYFTIDDDELRFMVVFASEKISSHLKTKQPLHVDATYRLVWQGYPILRFGSVYFELLGLHIRTEN